MRNNTTTPTAIAVAAGLTICASLLTLHRIRRQAQPPTTQQLTDAHCAGYSLALTHVSRGLLRASPEEP